jgi:hypothetical protein
MNSIELARAQGVEISNGGGRRRRNVIAGEGLVTPLRPLELHEDGTDAVLQPGRDRLAPEHWAVRERPELFYPAMKGDRATATRLRALLVRAAQGVRREMRIGRPSPPRRVGDAPGPQLPRQGLKWKLP